MFFWKIVTRKGVDFGTNGVFRRNFLEWNGSNMHKCINVHARQRERKVMWPLLYTCTLLRFNKSCRPLNADNQTTCHLRIKSSTVSSFLHSKNPSDPCHNLSMILLQIVIVSPGTMSPGTHLVKNHECSPPRTSESQ